MKALLTISFRLCFTVILLASCSAYHRSMENYQTALATGDYKAANRLLENNKQLGKNRNAVLYNLEKGVVALQQGDLQKSNQYLNRADQLMEVQSAAATNVAGSLFLNPMHTEYRGEDFEKILVHYYKALNYAEAGQIEDAVVEARRITLTNERLLIKSKSDKDYDRDAFSYNLQGMIYESAGDHNNAFIAYRNAVDAYQRQGGRYGANIPLSLAADLRSTAAKAGLTADLSPFKTIFAAHNFSEEAIPVYDDKRELVLFIEQGQGPVKDERDFMITAGAGLGEFFYTDVNGFNRPFNINYQASNLDEAKLTSLRNFRIALPYYSFRTVRQAPLVVHANGTDYKPELGENINQLASVSLSERMPGELAKAGARLVAKKLLELGAAGVAEGVTKNNKADSTDLKKAERDLKAEAAGRTAGFIVNLINTATEKADTRSWQTLPAFISYVRLPLKEGENQITVTENGITQMITVSGTPGLQMKRMKFP